MADNGTFQSATPATLPASFIVSTDEVTIGGVTAHVQRVKLVDGADGGNELVGGTAANGLKVDVTRVQGNVATVGSVAHDAPDTDAPVKVGGYAKSTAPTDVADGDRVNAWFGLDGRQKVDPLPPSAPSASTYLPVRLTDGSSFYTLAGGGGGGGITDKATFVEGGGTFSPIGGVVNDTIGTDPTEDQAAAVRITPKRGMHVNLRNASGVELGTASDPLIVRQTNSPVAEASGTIPPSTLGSVIVDVPDGASAVTVYIDRTEVVFGTYGRIDFGGSIDGSTWLPVRLQGEIYKDLVSEITATSNPLDQYFHGSVAGFKHFRVRNSDTWDSGTASIVIRADTGIHGVNLYQKFANRTTDFEDGRDIPAFVPMMRDASASQYARIRGDTTNGLDVDVTRVIPGTGATHLGKAESGDHADGDTGVMILGVRNDAGTALAADGKYIPLSMDSSGAVRVTGGGGGTQYTEGDTDSSITGTALLWEDTSDTLRAVSASKPLPVNIVSGSGSGVSHTDGAAFTEDTDDFVPLGGVFNDGLDPVTPGDGAATRITEARALHVNLRDADGDELGTAMSPLAVDALSLPTGSLAAVTAITADYDTGGGTQTMPLVGLALPGSGGAVAGGTASNPVRVDPTGSTTQPVSGSVSISGTPTVEVSVALPAGTNAIGKLAANSGVDIGDVDVLTLPADPLGANADAIVAAGASGSISAKLRRVTQGLEDLKTGIVLAAGTAAIGKLAANSGVDIGDVDVTSLPSIPAGNNNIGDVDIASIAAGTNAIGNVGIVPRTSGGVSVYRVIAAASTNAANIKASAGQVFGWQITNRHTSWQSVKLYNTSGTPTAGSGTPLLTLDIPPGGGATFFGPTGIAFGTGIGITIVGGIVDSDSANATASSVAVNIFYA